MRESEKGYAKEAWKNLTWKQKIRQFCDYYLIYVLVIGAIAVGLIMFIVNLVSRHEDYIMTCAVFNDYWDEDASEELKAELRERLDIDDPYEQVLFREGMTRNSTSEVMAFSVFVATQSIDAVICGKEDFDYYASHGMFFDLSEILTAEEYETWSSRIYETMGEVPESDAESLSTAAGETGSEESALSGETVGSESAAASYAEPLQETDGSAGDENASESSLYIKPYGLELQNSAWWNRLSTFECEDPVIGIICNTNYLENAKEFVRMMMEE